MFQNSFAPTLLQRTLDVFRPLRDDFGLRQQLDQLWIRLFEEQNLKGWRLEVTSKDEALVNFVEQRIELGLVAHTKDTLLLCVAHVLADRFKQSEQVEWFELAKQYLRREPKESNCAFTVVRKEKPVVVREAIAEVVAEVKNEEIIEVAPQMAELVEDVSVATGGSVAETQVVEEVQVAEAGEALLRDEPQLPSVDEEEIVKPIRKKKTVPLSKRKKKK